MRRMYSKNQVKGIVETGDLNVNGAISQSKANYDFDLSDKTPVNLASGFEYRCIYGRLEVINNILYVVWVFGLKNTNESATNSGNVFIQVEMPNELGDKIIDVNGKKVSEQIDNETQITCDVLFHGSNSYPEQINRTQKILSISNTTTAKNMKLNAFVGYNVDPDVEIICETRTFLTIL